MTVFRNSAGVPLLLSGELIRGKGLASSLTGPGPTGPQRPSGPTSRPPPTPPANAGPVDFLSRPNVKRLGYLLTPGQVSVPSDLRS